VSDGTLKTMTVKGFDGQEYQVTTAEAITLMQLGIDASSKPESASLTPTVEPEPLTADEKIDKLNQELQEYKQKNDNLAKEAKTRVELDALIDKVDILKNNPILQQGAKLQALAIQATNPRFSLADAVAIVAKDRLAAKAANDKEWQEKIDSNTVLKNAMSSVISDNGNLPSLDVEKAYTIEDVRNGTSRRLLTEMLNASRGVT